MAQNLKESDLEGFLQQFLDKEEDDAGSLSRVSNPSYQMQNSKFLVNR